MEAFEALNNYYNLKNEHDRVLPATILWNI